MMGYHALIIDDEAGNREFLATQIKQHCPSISKVRESSSAAEGILVVKNNDIDVVFLDIEMPGGNGFDFLNQVGEVNFHIIFVTAFDSYALKAIKYSALDYLLKPVDPLELVQAVEKLHRNQSEKERLELLKYNLSNREDRRIALPTQDEVVFVLIGDIIRLEAEANYTRIFIDKNPPLLLSGNIGHFERFLHDTRFYRTHQSHLINKDHIRKYIKTEGGYFLMSDGTQVPVSRLKKEEVKRLLM
ncbi:LytR/AlgR family response regulator transcription factor [Cognataquiflexum rubidum]|uniref:LytR/AlgR family response regulator transcription factor n=1 Tax=Cognataquiflexum rubidum TaxID=2922273 RepID=UPI001F14302B|nr:LytTR family DNA-binding domain-containing protein [Cognataquiflexum rubidum]MCH6232456.1 LytTR family DNA-binding domain-containing protein [Cognataquiflexum rubidum]